MSNDPSEDGGQRAAAADVPGADSAASDDGTHVRYSLPERALVWLCLTAFCAMIVATLAQVVFRYVLEVPVAWTEEAARTLFVLCMVMAIAFAWREREHIVVDFWFAGLGPRWQRAVGLVFDFAILAFIAGWARGAWLLAQVNATSTLTTIPFFRVSYFYYWELVAILLLAVYVIIDIRDRLAGAGDAIGSNRDA